MTVNSDSDFNTWFNQVSKHIYHLICVDIKDLPDNTFREDFEEGTTYQVMADKVVKDTVWEEFYIARKNQFNLD